MRTYDAVSYTHLLKYASMLIRSRLIDYARKERRHRQTVSLDAPAAGEESAPLGETLPEEDVYKRQRPAPTEAAAETGGCRAAPGECVRRIAGRYACPA